MWVQKLRTSKPVIIALVVLMLVFSFEASRPQAVGLDTAVKIVAGSSAQKVVRSIGEKAGMAFTPKSLQATTDYINGQAAKGNQKYIDLAKGVNTAAGTGIDVATKPGWKKYALDPILWLTGADLLVEAYDAFNDARLNNEQIDVYGKYPSGGASCYPSDMGDGFTMIYAKHAGSALSKTVERLNTGDKPTCEVLEVEKVSSTSNTSVYVYIMTKRNGSNWNQHRIQFDIDDYDKYTQDQIMPRYSTSDDDIDMSNVTNANTYRNTIDNDDYSRVTYDNDIEIYAPDTDTTYNNDYATPWNTKMDDEEFNIIVKPIQDVDVVVPPATGDDDDDLPTGKRPDPVEVLDRSVLDVMVKSYEFFDDAIDATVSSMKSVVDGAAGIVTFLDDSMDWLPAEWRAVFVSTFLLGVFAHFFRR